MGVFHGWKERRDYVTLEGRAIRHNTNFDGDWSLFIQPAEGFTLLAINSEGRRNENGEIECEVEPNDLFTNDALEHVYFGRLMSKRVTVNGTWVDDLAHDGKTEIHPITSILQVDKFSDKTFINFDQDVWNDQVRSIKHFISCLTIQRRVVCYP